MLTAKQFRDELERWLRANASVHNRQAMLAERKGTKAIQTAKADVYSHIAGVVATWNIGHDE